jgi:hypothetical protein
VVAARGYITLWREVRTHSRSVFAHLGVFAFQTVKDLGCGLRLSAATTLFDFATQAVDYSFAALLILFE